MEILFKRCTHCTLLKYIDAFYKTNKRNRNPEERMSRCKKCFNSIMTIYQAGKGKTMHARALFRYSQTEKGRAVSRASALKYQKSEKARKHRELPHVKVQIKARAALNHAIRDGHVSKPSVCSQCQQPHNRIHGHHYLGYDKEHWLNVKWLCPRCHKFAE